LKAVQNIVNDRASCKSLNHDEFSKNKPILSWYNVFDLPKYQNQERLNE
jgi:hypothetical protein